MQVKSPLLQSLHIIKGKNNSLTMYLSRQVAQPEQQMNKLHGKVSLQCGRMMGNPFQPCLTFPMYSQVKMC